MPYDIKIIIIGAGVAGLTTGIELLNNGYTNVKIIASQLHPNITSSIAAAVWVPYKVAPEAKAKTWCKQSLERFAELSQKEDTGVSWINCTQVYTKPDMKQEWTDLTISCESPIYLPSGYQTIISNKIPLMDTAIYMPWLKNEFLHLGGAIELKSINSLDEVSKKAELIINCAGLGAKELASDASLQSVSGQIIICRLPEQLDYCIACDEDPNCLTYIIPRKQSNTCIIGGTAIENDADSDVDPTITTAIWQRALKLCPLLDSVDLTSASIAKGFRPARHEVRLEVDNPSGNTPIIHNYGHGGGGFAISWGCAIQACEYVNDLFPQNSLRLGRRY